MSGVISKPLIKNKSFSLPYHNNQFVLELDIIVIRLVNPIYGCGIKITPDMNPIYVVLERSCPRDSKNVSYVDVGLV